MQFSKSQPNIKQVLKTCTCDWAYAFMALVLSRTHCQPIIVSGSPHTSQAKH